MVNLSPVYQPVLIKGLTVDQHDPFRFDFIVDLGQERSIQEPALKQEGEKLIRYFLASLAIPENDLWVNLSPYEKDRIIPSTLGLTDLGRDMLAEDYLLKQITASLIYPEKELGKNFWDRVYALAHTLYGTTQIPVNTFNKVWIKADKAEIYEHNQTAYVAGCHLKVMLEEDYLASKKHAVLPAQKNFSSRLVRRIILPELEIEVNTGRNFAHLRQIFHSLILAAWYKKRLAKALLNQIYSNQGKIKGIDLQDPLIKDKIYSRYLRAYKKGVFNFIKDEKDEAGAPMPRKYFSGGIDTHLDLAMVHDVPRETANGDEPLRLFHVAMTPLQRSSTGLQTHALQDQAMLEMDSAPDRIMDDEGVRGYPTAGIVPADGVKDSPTARTIPADLDVGDRIVTAFDPKLKELRVSEVRRRYLDSQAEENLFQHIEDHPGAHIFFLKKSVILENLGKYIQLEASMGRIPGDLIGSWVEISINNGELFKRFGSTLPSEEWINGPKKNKKILAKFGTFYDIRAWDGHYNEELVALSINHTRWLQSIGRRLSRTNGTAGIDASKLNGITAKRERRLKVISGIQEKRYKATAIGGADELSWVLRTRTDGHGKTEEYKHIVGAYFYNGINMTVPRGEKPEDFRRLIQAKDAPALLALYHQDIRHNNGAGIELNKGIREVTEEWEKEMHLGPLPELHLKPVSDRRDLARSKLFQPAIRTLQSNLRPDQLLDDQLFVLSREESADFVYLVNRDHGAQFPGPHIRFTITDEGTGHLVGFVTSSPSLQSNNMLLTQLAVRKGFEQSRVADWLLGLSYQEYMKRGFTRAEIVTDNDRSAWMMEQRGAEIYAHRYQEHVQQKVYYASVLRALWNLRTRFKLRYGARSAFLRSSAVDWLTFHMDDLLKGLPLWDEIVKYHESQRPGFRFLPRERKFISVKAVGDWGLVNAMLQARLMDADPNALIDISLAIQDTYHPDPLDQKTIHFIGVYPVSQLKGFPLQEVLQRDWRNTGDYLHRVYYSYPNLPRPVLYQTALTLHIGESNGRGFMGPMLSKLEQVIRDKYRGYLLVGMTSHPAMKKFYDRFRWAVKARDIRLAKTLIEHNESSEERSAEGVQWQWRDVTADLAMPSPEGGIDLNTGDMGLDTKVLGQGVQMHFDQAMINRIKSQQYDGMGFQIKSIGPVTSLPLLLK